jgi:predicted nucleic acid-binding protein
VIARNEVFLDTSGLFAAAFPRSDDHDSAARAFEGLLRSGTALLTTDLVVAESHGLSLGRLGPGRALLLAERLVASPRIEIVDVGLARIERGLELLRSRPERRISLVDATSFEVMRERGVEMAFTLDEDFAAEGFRIVPAR